MILSGLGDSKWCCGEPKVILSCSWSGHGVVLWYVKWLDGDADVDQER